jgi:hypothetical protein
MNDINSGLNLLHNRVQTEVCSSYRNKGSKVQLTYFFELEVLVQ